MSDFATLSNLGMTNRINVLAQFNAGQAGQAAASYNGFIGQANAAGQAALFNDQNIAAAGQAMAGFGFGQVGSQAAGPMQRFLERERAIETETPEECEERKLRELKSSLEREWVTMPPSVLPFNWKPLSRWELFKLGFALKLIKFGEVKV